jgi:hypothetical protein
MRTSIPFLALLYFANALPSSSDPSLPQCRSDEANISIDAFNQYAFKACERFFKDKEPPKGPVQTTVHMFLGSRGETAAGRGDRSDIYLPVTYKLDGDVKGMNQGKCEYAFTNPAVYGLNKQKSNVCHPKGLNYISVQGWEFEKEGRKYAAEVHKMEYPPRSDKKEYWD